MFKKNSVPAIIAEGLDWVERLETASEVTTEKARALQEKANAINAEADAARQTATEGLVIAANFRQMFEVKS